MGMIVDNLDRASGREGISRGILHARIMHARLAPSRYVLRHRLWYLNLPLHETAKLDSRWLKHNRPGIFSLRDRDYGDGQKPLAEWLAQAFEAAGAAAPGGEVRLLTLPRVFGFGFNPVSFWLCHDKNGALRSVLAEVNNTFGDRHCYLVRKEDGSPIRNEDRLTGKKVFHVSPFLPIDGDYAFRFVEHEDELAIQIDLIRSGRRVLTATINGTFAPLDARELRRCFWRYPLPAVQVLGLIHYHALRLWMRGLSVFSRPEPPDAFITQASVSDTPSKRIATR